MFFLFNHDVFVYILCIVSCITYLFHVYTVGMSYGSLQGKTGRPNLVALKLVS